MKQRYDDQEKRQQLIGFLNFIKQHCEFKAFSIDAARKLYGISSNSAQALMSAKILKKTDQGFRWITGDVNDQIADLFVDALRTKNCSYVNKNQHAQQTKKTADITSALLEQIIERLDYQNKLLSSFIHSFGVNE